MNFKLLLSAALLAAGVSLAAIPSQAGAIGGYNSIKTLGAEQPSNVEQAHFWHRTCRRGLNGWHKHVKGVGRVQCTNYVCRHGRHCRWF
jgi:hypothetical protein